MPAGRPLWASGLVADRGLFAKMGLDGLPHGFGSLRPVEPDFVMGVGRCLSILETQGRRHIRENRPRVQNRVVPSRLDGANGQSVVNTSRVLRPIPACAAGHSWRYS